MGLDKWIMSGIYNYSVTQNNFPALKIPWVRFLYLSLPRLLATTDLFIVFSFAFSRMPCTWNLLSLINSPLRCFHVFLGLDSCAFFFFLTCPLYGYGFPGGTVSKESACQCKRGKNVDSVSGLGRSPGRGNGNLFQYPWLENSKDRGACWATVHGVTKSWIQLRLCEHACVWMHQYLFTCWRTSCLLLNFSSYKQSGYKHPCAGFCVRNFQLTLDKFTVFIMSIIIYSALFRTFFSSLPLLLFPIYFIV